MHQLLSTTFSWDKKTKWDYNWDKRAPSSLVKPISRDASQEKVEEFNEAMKNAKSKAVRTIIMVRHGQYNLDGRDDTERYLTELGREQAAATGERLALLHKQLACSSETKDENGNIVKPCLRLVKSTMTRATQTADIVHSHFPELPIESCDLLREGAPCKPDPPSDTWVPDESSFYQEGARIEAAFRKYFHRADPSQTENSVDVLVCHGNVIRYFICRALQVDPQAWLRMAVHNGSITEISIMPSGRVRLTCVGETGHLPPRLLTFN